MARESPATVANPPVITAISSDCVMVSTYGLTTSGASVCPTKMLADADSDSEPEVPMKRTMNALMTFTRTCIMPR